MKNGRVIWQSFHRRSRRTPAIGEKDDDDPGQIDTVVLGDPADAPQPARRGDHISAGQLLYNWLATFNRASYPPLSLLCPMLLSIPL
jgi:hypothetical protein